MPVENPKPAFVRRHTALVTEYRSAAADDSVTINDHDHIRNLDSNIVKYPYQCLFPAVVICLLAGCASLAGRHKDESFETYAERVFRHQNQVGNRLLLMLMDYTDDPRLLQAEQRLLEACQELNNMAIRKMQRQTTNPVTQYKTRLSVKECDRVSRDTEKILNDYAPANHGRTDPGPVE